MWSRKDTGWLFKRTITGDIVRWRGVIKQDSDWIKYPIEDSACYINVTWGSLTTGNTSVSNTALCEPKNIGKRNETTSWEQAIKELKSLYNAQLKKGYKEVPAISTAMDSYFKDSLLNAYIHADKALPKFNTTHDGGNAFMKCQKIAPRPELLPAKAQPKINGVRSEILWDEEYYKTLQKEAGLFDKVPDWKKVRIRSKNGLTYSIEHIQRVFYNIYISLENTVPYIKQISFDGEMYIKGKPVATIGGACRNPNNENHKSLMFVLFDLTIPDKVQSERFNMIEEGIDILINMSAYAKDDIFICEDACQHDMFTKFPIVYIKPIVINDECGAALYMEHCIEHGFEGAVLRCGNYEYAFGQRPQWMIKMKKAQDADCMIVAVRHVGIPTQRVGFSIVFECVNDIDNQHFDVTYLASYERKLEVFRDNNKVIGKMVELRFYERTKNNLPLHILSTEVRDYE